MGGPPPLVDVRVVLLVFVGLLHQFDQSCRRRHESLPTDDWCPCFRWIQSAHDDLVKNIVVDGDSTRPSMKVLGIPAASRLPVVEGETLAVGVSERMLSVMDVGLLRTEASQSPEGECLVWTVEGETLADGVSTRMLEVMDVGSVRTAASRSDGRCHLGSRRVVEFTQERNCRH